jgi:hypothetical protein
MNMNMEQYFSNIMTDKIECFIEYLLTWSVSGVCVVHLFSCFVCLCPVSCVTNVACVSGLSILDCQFGYFQNGVRQLRSPAKMATTVQLRCYWKQFWSRWAITGSWEPLVLYYFSYFQQLFKIKDPFYKIINVSPIQEHPYQTRYKLNCIEEIKS